MKYYGKYDDPKDLVPKEYVDNSLLNKQSQHKTATATLTYDDWSNNTQTVNVTGVTASNSVMVAPAPASASDYGDAGILCTAQASGTLTFTCESTPSNNITVNVLILD